MNTKQNVCLALRGELLRNPLSSYHTNPKNKQLRKPDLSEGSVFRQDKIMKSIIDNIIIPYEKNGFNVFVSGCVYECNDYNNKLKEFFPNNTIKQIEAGKTNQAELFYKSIEQAEKEHPDCIEYVSLRVDYLMLKNVIRKDLDLNLTYVGFAWKNNKFPQVDVFYIISKNAVDIFKKILNILGARNNYCHTHPITGRLKHKNVLLYPIWNNYENKAAGITYNDYIKQIKLHKNKPFVNYMKYNNNKS